MRYAYMVLVREGLPCFTPKVPPTTVIKSSRKYSVLYGSNSLGKYPYPDTAYTNRDGSRDRATNIIRQDAFR